MGCVSRQKGDVTESPLIECARNQGSEPNSTITDAAMVRNGDGAKQCRSRARRTNPKGENGAQVRKQSLLLRLSLYARTAAPPMTTAPMKAKAGTARPAAPLEPDDDEPELAALAALDSDADVGEPAASTADDPPPFMGE